MSKSMLTNKFYRVLGDIADDMNSKDNQKIIFESSSLSKRLPITLMIVLSLLCGLVRSLYAAEGDLSIAFFLSLFPLTALLVLTQLPSKPGISNKNIFNRMEYPFRAQLRHHIVSKISLHRTVFSADAYLFHYLLLWHGNFPLSCAKAYPIWDGNVRPHSWL